MSEKDVYKMKAHEMRMVGEIKDSLATVVLRVPGGWIYSQFDKSHNMTASVFVPFNNEFQGQMSND